MSNEISKEERAEAIEKLRHQSYMLTQIANKLEEGDDVKFVSALVYECDEEHNPMTGKGCNTVSLATISNRSISKNFIDIACEYASEGLRHSLNNKEIL